MTGTISGFDFVKDTPAWIQGVGTVVAFGWSVYLLRLDRALDRGKERSENADFSRALLIMINQALITMHREITMLRYESRDDHSDTLTSFDASLLSIKEEVDSITAPFTSVPMTEWPSYELHALFSTWVRDYNSLFWPHGMTGTMDPREVHALRMDIGNRLATTLQSLERQRREIESVSGVSPLPYARADVEAELLDSQGNPLR